MWKIILLLVFLSFSLYGYSQDNSVKEYKLLVNLHNAPFSSLAILDYRDSHNVIIKGKSIGRFKWEFTVPDSIVANSENMLLFVPDKDTIANAYHQIRFNRKFKNKKTSSANIGIQEENNYIEADYTGKTLYQTNNAFFMGLTDSVVVGNLICEDFNLLIKNDSSDITVRSFEPSYAWFVDDDKINLSYAEHVHSYLNLAKKYPGSRYLLTYLALNLNQFRSREDVKNIYRNFSKNITSSKKWSTKIERFLSDDFQNLPLMDLNLKHIEPIIQDSSKYNLVVFSASWCPACIKEIPLLKELYKNLKEHLNFTYISMDYEKDIQTFQKLLIKNDIPWRTLYAYKDLDRIKNLFSITSIPHSLLVYPNGHMEVIDVRSEQIQKKLCSKVMTSVIK